MSGVLSYIASGRLQAAAASSLCAVASLKVPPLGYASGAVIGVMTLRYGAAEGAVMVAGSALLAGLVCLFLPVPADSIAARLAPVLVFAAASWLPVWLLAMVLRATAAQGPALAVAGILGAVLVLGLHWLVPEPAAWWGGVLSDLFKASADAAGFAPGSEQARGLARVAELLGPHMTGIIAAGTVLGLVLSLLLARWWHAKLDNPGGFGREFRSLVMPRRMALAAVPVAALALFADPLTGGLAGDLLWVLVMLYLVQGLAVAHALVRARGSSGAWLVAIYLLVGLLPLQAGLTMVMVGYADHWLGFRRRFASEGS